LLEVEAEQVVQEVIQEQLYQEVQVAEEQEMMLYLL
jgi:hypothetical protein|tara:strand:- start:126 stop:233 length:108 start_codon:yes stop_codon:yes gene_type:complete